MVRPAARRGGAAAGAARVAPGGAAWARVDEGGVHDIAEVPVNPCFENIALIDERTLEITFRKDKANAGQVLASLTAAGLEIVDVSTRDPDLEDVFLSLVAADEAA